MLNTICAIAKNTFKECLREPIYLLVLISVLCMIGLFPIFSMFVFREQEKLVTDSALATIMLFGWALAILVASFAVSREIDNGTALLLLSKPVNRHAFILGKILGIVTALTVFWLITSASGLIALRIAADQFRFDGWIMAAYAAAILLSFLIAGIANYVYQSSFSMVTILSLIGTILLVGVFAQFKYNGETESYGLAWHILPAILLILFSLICMGTLATTLSTRFGLVSNLLICCVIFVLGLLSDYLVGRHAREPWSDSVPKGQETLWMAHYRFAPTEKFDVDKWDKPVRLDGEDAFILWTAADEPGILPKDLGDDPAPAWEDQQGWCRNPNDVKGKITFMAQYSLFDKANRWTVTRIANEAQAFGKPDSQNLDDAYDAYVFRRSFAPPRTPDGGSYLVPIPTGGSYLASAIYAVIPNWQVFWMADALAVKIDIPWAYVAWSAAYTALFTALLAVIAMLLFAHREIGRQIIS